MIWEPIWELKARLESGSVVTAAIVILGKKVCAAQWQQLDAKYFTVKNWKKTDSPNQLKLSNVSSVQAERREPTVAEVHLYHNGSMDEKYHKDEAAEA